MMHIVPNRVTGLRPLTSFACMAFFTVLIAGACKKKDEKGVTERLMNKWSLVQMLDTVYASGAAPVPGQYSGKSGDYMDFRKDGKRYSFIDNNYDTANYTYSEQNLKVNVSGRKYNILILTDNTMVLHEPKYATSSTDYVAYKITLKR
ncbi:hypothetical protein FAM09_01535 [Niastella caeni]|uniref:Lipocalin-like domain-containing protein n=1 Tax=Niastella caeni TaxID=2569763 RepID=A0A4S8I3L3_9BACT|nr:lipocalin family protein [Niastella caeni]THU40822.1 hypothetical protein FAM09_01535 [Niastella caeni]